MAATVTTAMCTSFKENLLKGKHNFDNGDTFKIALISADSSATGTYDATTTSYTQLQGNGEVSGGGYSAGGQALDSPTVTTSGTTAFVDFANETFSTVTVSAIGCLIYNDSDSGKLAVATFSFGGTVSSTAGDFTIQFPTANATNAIIRIA
ncbi:MAG: hypothetical protein CBC83_02370 [Flavobacteriales bacterium TMED123]|nr:hypothetical protein [Candidatus Neomarinimicrobiota bacterium]MAJ44527.1 hypothetical protein [Candidatus Neomarinimicrobiota bacterium]OUV73963.1 MAG: hypothetical protein CBC83_04815 [Flavobacteriales bacterium TMED123]OUV75604.1 MAG: hypothetical protein CBC83_02370 [Flavobacteriales bacterium TMED123]|tara:strand:- start:1231 stop:1683 length:453 start_codon:yes stop_codon:yes gene_type:complete